MDNPFIVITAFRQKLAVILDSSRNGVSRVYDTITVLSYWATARPGTKEVAQFDMQHLACERATVSQS